MRPLSALTRHHFGVYIAALPGQCGRRQSRIKRVITGATEIETILTIFQLLTAPILTSKLTIRLNRHKHWKSKGRLNLARSLSCEPLGESAGYGAISS